MVTALVASGEIPESARILLLAPAIDIIKNTEKTALELKAFRLWSSYCDFVEIGCKVPNPIGVDPAAVEDIYAQNIFFYIVPDAVLQLFAYADAVAPLVGGIKRPIDIVMARDDGEVNFAGTREICSGLSSCRLYAFETGGHAPMFGSNSAALNSLLLRLADDPGAGCEGLPCGVVVPAQAAGPALPGPRRHARAAIEETPSWH